MYIGLYVHNGYPVLVGRSQSAEGLNYLSNKTHIEDDRLLINSP